MATRKITLRRLCNKCWKLKDEETEFRKRTCSKQGTTYYKRFCIPCEKEMREAWRKVNKHREHGYFLMRTYGITQDEFDALVKAQDSRCGACGRRCSVKRGGPTGSSLHVLCIDHCHKTGVVRGLLCGRCNMALGLIGDNAELVEQLLAYLKRGQS